MSANFPIFRTVEEFQDKAGAKLKALIKLIRDDRVLPVEQWSQDLLTMVYPDPPPPLPDSEPERTCKILVYFSFSMMRETVVSVSHSMKFTT